MILVIEVIFYLEIVNGLDARLTETQNSNNLANDQTKKGASDYVWQELYSYIEVAELPEDIKAGLHEMTDFISL